jgi:hypothetical protein
MNTIEQLEAALAVARRLGYEVRLERLDGPDGGACEVRGRKQLFVDLNSPPREQLETVLEALRRADAASRTVGPPGAAISTSAA